jgi:hypothetical protein
MDCLNNQGCIQFLIANYIIQKLSVELGKES